MDKKRALGYILTVTLSILYLFFANKAANANKVYYESNTPGIPEKMKVTKILDEEYHKIVYEGYETTDSIILFEGEFLSGYRKGTVVQVVQTIDSMYAIEQRQIAVGDKIIVYDNYNIAIPEVEYMFAEYIRFDFLLMLALLFTVLLLLFGRGKGVNTLISLGFTIASIFFVFIPAVLNGGNVYMWAISTCIFIILMTLTIISGLSKKSLAAIIGCASGVGIAGILTIVTDKFIHLTGLVNEESMYLLFLNNENPIDLKAIIFAAIVIGAIGAIMDVAMSISSSLAELKEQAGPMTAAQITKSGLVIGRDIMGTMANTLILAYIGCSLSLTLLLAASNNSNLLLFNTEMIIVEILQALAGSFGILLTIPLTSVICGILYQDKEPTINIEENIIND